MLKSSLPNRIPPTPPTPPTVQMGAVWARRRSRLLRRSARVGALALFVLTFALFAARFVYADAIYPGVSLGDINIGGLDRNAAKSVVDEQTAAFVSGPLVFTYEKTSWTPALADLGASISVEAALNSAYNIARSGTPRDQIVAVGHLLNHDERLPLTLQLNGAALNSWFDTVDADLAQPAKDAELVIDGTKVTIAPEQTGLMVDRAAATDLIYSTLQQLQSTSVALPVITAEPTVRTADLEASQATLEKVFSSPVTVTFEKQSWTVTAEQIAPFVAWSDTDNSYIVDESALSVWLKNEFQERVNRDAVDAEVAWDNERKGLVSTEPSVDGIALKPRSFAKAVIASFSGDHTQVDIPVSVTNPRIDSNNLKALGITTRLAVGDSNYEGSNDGRATNIEVGSKLLNGTLVPPGEQFSFNHAVGIISEDAGFVEAQVIVGERIGRDIGGGICQVSTTVYRAALQAGLEITEWWPHTYRLAFYEQDGWQPGYDASILQPEGDPFGGGDFQFTNTSDSWMLVESYADGARVVVIIYGEDLGYKVSLGKLSMSDPIPVAPDLEIVDETLPPGSMNQTETAIEGLETSFTRTVTDSNGNVVREDTWPTRFEPRGNVWQVSPDMKGKSPAAKASS